MPLLQATISDEAGALMLGAGTLVLAPLFATLETRTTLNTRALSNLKFGELVTNPSKVVEYCTMLKQLDDATHAADNTHALLMPGGSSTWASRVLDTVQDAVALLIPGGFGPPGGVGMGTAVPDFATAIRDAVSATAVDQLKEVTTSYMTECHARVYDCYRLRMEEDMVGNRAALYKAHRYLGDGSEHVYPSKEQFPLQAIKNSSGGGMSLPLVPTVNSSGHLGVATQESEVQVMRHSYVTAAHAKLKINTIFLELAGVGIPGGYDGSGAGKVPGKPDCQFGLSELLDYRAVLDRGAGIVPNVA